jgi:hypothetical protein
MSSSACFSQSQPSKVDPRWRLLDPGHAVIPISDLIHMAAVRLTIDEKKEQYRMDALGRSKEILALRGVLDKKDRQIGNLEGQNEQLRDENEYLQMDLAECDMKSAKLRPWATMGRIAVYGGIAVAAYFGYKELDR